MTATAGNPADAAGAAEVPAEGLGPDAADAACMAPEGECRLERAGATPSGEALARRPKCHWPDGPCRH